MEVANAGLAFHVRSFSGPCSDPKNRASPAGASNAGLPGSEILSDCAAATGAGESIDNQRAPAADEEDRIAAGN